MMHLWHLLLALLLLAISSICQEYYVSPNSEFSDSKCPSPGNCHPLSYYVSNASDAFTSGNNISLLFLDGVYDLSDFPSITNVGSLNISALNSSFDLNSPLVTLIGASINLNSILELTIQRIHFMKSNLRLVGNYQVVTIQQVSFKSSELFLRIEKLQKLFIENSEFGASNFFLLFQPNFEKNDTFAFNLRSTNFQGNSNTKFVIDSRAQTNLVMDHVQISDYSLMVLIQLGSSINEVSLVNSTLKGLQAGLQFIAVQEQGSYLLVIADTRIVDSIDGIGLIDLAQNTSVIIQDITAINCSKGFSLFRPWGLAFEMELSGSRFIQNEIGLLLVNFGIGSFNTIITDTVFLRNINGAAIVGANDGHEVSTQHLTMRNVSFIHNIQLIEQELSGEIFGSISLRNLDKATIEDCLFDNNKGYSTLISRTSNLFFKGTTTMANNLGINGGALVILNSVIWLTNQTTIRFINNTAIEVGGAILFQEESVPEIYGLSNIYPPCNYQLAFDLEQPIDPDSIDVTLEFYNNTAPTGGDHIYGAALKSQCAVTPDETITSDQIWKHIFKFMDNSSSPVSSTPRRVCLCKNGVPNCAIPLSELYFPVSISPGEKFTLNVALVGNDFGITTGSVYALDLHGTKSKFLFGTGEELQQIETRECWNLEYSVHIRDPYTKSVGLLLSTDIITAASQQVFFSAPAVDEVYESAVDNYLSENFIDVELLTAPVLVNFTILDCPPGLVLNDSEATPGVFQCTCETQLTDYINECRVVNNSGSFSRNGSVWIGKGTLNTINGTKHVVLANEICPVQYCRTKNIWLQLGDSDMQCVRERQGVLCGECIEHYSVAIGSSRCVPCPNNNGLAYISLFIVLGIVLVVCMKYLDLTLAQATINGLIFYANILWINQEIFFPIIENNFSQPYLHYTKLLRVFIAWLNFDFGIEVCFISGLTAYYKTWLQFIFPIYICLIALFIAVLVSYSTRATKFFGNNAVHLLPTLFFFSCSKFLRTIASALNPTQLQQFYPSGTQHVWTLDGNIPYFVSKHAPLFLVALCFGAVICIYCAVLLFAGPLHRVQNRKISGYVNKIHPLLEAHTGPLNVNYQFWIGLTLLFRIILVIVNVIFETANPINIIAVIIVLVMILLSMVNRVYRKRYIFFLELFFLLNLGIVCVAFLGNSVRRTRSIVINISATISFVVFFGIIIGHLCSRIKKRIAGKFCFKKKESNTESKVEMQLQPSDYRFSGVDFEFLARSTEDFRESIFDDQL